MQSVELKVQLFHVKNLRLRVWIKYSQIILHVGISGVIVLIVKSENLLTSNGCILMVIYILLMSEIFKAFNIVIISINLIDFMILSLVIQSKVLILRLTDL